MKRFLRPLTVVLLTLTALLFAFELIKSVIWACECILKDSSLRRYLLWFLAGGGFYWLIMCVVWRKYLTLIQTSVHEWLHAFACMVMFRDVQSISSSSNGGGVMYHSGDSNLFISLSPYTLPILAYGALLVASLVPGRMAWFYAFAGFFFFLHMHAFMTQIGGHQTDIRKNGMYTSTVYITTFLSMNVAICIYAAGLKLWPGICHFFTVTWSDLSGIVGSLLSL